MNVKVFGPGCAKCTEVEVMAKKLVEENNINATVEKVTDLKEMMRFGILATPAVAVNDVVKCTGRVPTAAEMTEWLSPVCSCGGKC